LLSGKGRNQAPIATQIANSATTSETRASHRVGVGGTAGGQGGGAADASSGFDTWWIVSFICGCGNHLLSALAGPEIEETFSANRFLPTTKAVSGPSPRRRRDSGQEEGCADWQSVCPQRV
jgi:hypothetical protein